MAITKSKGARGIQRALGIILVYGAILALLYTQPELVEAAPGVRLWAPMAGLHLAVLVLFGSAYLPLVLAATFAGGMLLGDPVGDPQYLLVPSLIVTLCYGGTAAWLRRALRTGPFQTTRLVYHVVPAALGLPVAVGVLSSLAGTLAGQPGFAWSSFAETAFQGWAADVVGMLTLTPLLVLALGPRLHGWAKETMAGASWLPPREGRPWAVFGLEAGGVALATYLAFSMTPGGAYPLYLCLVPVLWVAWHHGLPRTVLMIVLLTAGISVLLQAGAGAEAVPLFMVVLTGIGLVLGAHISERERTLAVLQQADAVLANRLENQVEERQRVEVSLQQSVDALRASRDDLEAAMLHQADLNEKLRASEQQLKDLNIRKDKFFSIVSHDVKSMLVSGIGFSKLLLSDAETLPRDMIKEFASHVHSSTTNTYDLLENLLTWTRMQTGRMLYQRAWHGVDDLIQNNITMLRDNAARKQIQLRREGDRDAQVYADRNMINSVLQNLISNAIKFTEHGGKVTVSSRTFEQTVEIAVRDNGVGINSENLRKLFRIDMNHSTPGTDEEDGTGLGLVLCKEMVEKHEGRIWAESEPGKGSSFYFTLPCAAAAEHIGGDGESPTRR